MQDILLTHEDASIVRSALLVLQLRLIKERDALKAEGENVGAETIQKRIDRCEALIQYAS